MKGELIADGRTFLVADLRQSADDLQVMLRSSYHHETGMILHALLDAFERDQQNTYAIALLDVVTTRDEARAAIRIAHHRLQLLARELGDERLDLANERRQRVLEVMAELKPHMR